MKSFIEILKEFGFGVGNKKEKSLHHISDPDYKKIDPTHQAVHPGPPKTILTPHKGVNPETGERNLPEDTETILRNELNLKNFFNLDGEDTE
jgi:hypothetical protein